MYAIVRAGGRQEKVAVGDVVRIDKVDRRARQFDHPPGGAGRRRRERSPATPRRWPASP